MINWGSRFRNKQFISALISMVLLAVKNLSGYEFPYEMDMLVDIVLTAISALGIVVDPSSEGFSDIQKKDELDETYDTVMEVIRVLCGEEIE